VENIDNLRKGLGFAIGDGRSTLFWTHKWAAPIAFVDLASQQIPSSDLSRLVCDYWDERRGWKWETFIHLLPDHALKSIASFELSKDRTFQDQLFWRGTSSGRFSLKYALLIIRHEEAAEGKAHWLHLWKLKAP